MASATVDVTVYVVSCKKCGELFVTLDKHLDYCDRCIMRHENILEEVSRDVGEFIEVIKKHAHKDKG